MGPHLELGFPFMNPQNNDDEDATSLSKPDATEKPKAFDQDAPTQITDLQVHLDSTRNDGLIEKTAPNQGQWTGKRLGEYLLGRLLGRGGMGEVYLATHERMERTVAIKLIARQAMHSPSVVSRFQREVKAAARLQHPNLVLAYDASELDGVQYLVMEYIQGSDLHDHVQRQGPVSWTTAVDIIRQAAQGLAHAHGKGILHRDVKPSNLMLTEQGVVKVLDLGLARLARGLAEDDEAHSLETRTGEVMGTSAFMAPEQAACTKEIDQRADIYSLGCTFFHLISGRHPYSGENLLSMAVAHREQPIPTLVEVVPDIPRSLQSVFDRMLAKRREKRYPSMELLIHDLDLILPNAQGTKNTPLESAVVAPLWDSADDESAERSELLEILDTCRLLSPTAAQEFILSFPPDKRPETTVELLSALTHADIITGFQSALLSLGEGRNLLAGNYVLEAKLSSGMMGDLFQAKHRETGKRVALRAWPLARSDDVAGWKAFELRLEKNLTLADPHILPVLEIGQDDYWFFVVMEHAAGGYLDWKLARTRVIPLADGINYLLQAAQGLAHAQAQGVVHGWVRADCFALDEQGQLQVSDFGSCTAPLGSQSEGLPADIAHSFIAPELKREKKPPTHLGDMYSLGSTFFFLVTGVRLAFGSEADSHRASDKIPLLADYIDRVPPYLQAIFERLVAVNPETRDVEFADVVHD